MTNFTKDEPMRAAIYARVSSPAQARRGFSLRAQMRTCRGYCWERGWHIAAEYQEVRTAFDVTRVRPQYDKLIADRDKWDVLVVASMDRIWRNPRSFSRMVSDLQGWGKSIVCVRDELDMSTSEGRFMANILQQIAHIESRNISERVKAAYDQRWELKPDSWFGRAPDGYRRVRGALVIDKEQAAVVRALFELALRGKTIMQIRDLAREMGLRGPQGGGYASTARINYLLRDPAYAGFAYHNGVIRPDAHTGIVSEDEFNEVQVAIFARTRTHPRWPIILRGQPVAVRPAKQGNHPRARRILYPVEKPPELDALVTSFLKKTGRSPARRDALQG